MLKFLFCEERQTLGLGGDKHLQENKRRILLIIQVPLGALLSQDNQGA
jgi:hypothetical protein